MLRRVLPAGFLTACIPAILLFPPMLSAAEKQTDDKQGVEFFEKKIRPVFVEKCYRCHSTTGKKSEGRLLLDSRSGVRKGGESGPAVVPGDVRKSLLLEAIRYEGLEMPPDEKLPDEVIADFEAWIKMGAPDPRGDSTAPVAQNKIDWKAAGRFWSFQPPRRHRQPKVNHSGWIKRPIDAFILAKLEQEGLSPNPAADKRTLIRRVTFDLTGLPPTAEEVESFLADDSPDANENLVERLLASPHYGERLARMWLDVSRYAEDQAHIVGNNKSLFYPNAYLYRDWVIQALNADVPYDRFIRLQLAADLLEPSNRSDRAALGFIGLGPKYYRRRAPEVMAEEWSDRVDTVTRGLLGLTVACARCHDHKYDPVPTEDYYALAGVFAGTEMFNRPLDDKRKKDDDGEAKDPEDALHIIRDSEPTDLHVYIRGDYKIEGPLVKRRFLKILSEGEPQPFTRGSGRLDLAEAIVEKENPLTARVIVNRIWAMNFGRPLVGTPSNFGRLGELPTHPELLDDLAVRFMDAGWSLKWLQREILLSSAYRQSSRIEPHYQAIDPANRLLWRMNRRRLDVEAWRDAILAASGELDRTVGGKSIQPDDPDETRRTLYSYISRLDLNPMLALFDFPDPNAHSAMRAETTTPLQKLFVLNSRFMVRRADGLVQRLNRLAGKNDAARIKRAYQILYGRPVGSEELRLALEFLSGDEKQKDARWVQYAQVLLASNEMLIVD